MHDEMNKADSSDDDGMEFADAKIEEVEDTLLATSKFKKRPLAQNEMQRISQNVNTNDLNESIVSVVQGLEPMVTPSTRRNSRGIPRTLSKVSSGSTGANAFGANFFNRQQ